MELAAVNSPAAAFAAGLVTSLHCAGMCGPLACALLPARAGAGSAPAVATAYHGARLAAYGLLGAVAGGLGAAPLGWVAGAAARWLPWLTVLLFVSLALGWERHLPRIPLLGRGLGRVHGWARGMDRTRAAATLGLATPLLPCGPLYFLLALALLSGSAVRGATWLLAFGCGTIPLLWLAQSRLGRVQALLSPRGLARLRVGLALAVALTAGWRLRATFGLPGPDPSHFVCH